MSIYDLATDQAVIYTLGNAPSGSPVILQWPDRATLEVRLGMNPNHVNFACVFEVIEQMPSNILPIQGITS